MTKTATREFPGYHRTTKPMLSRPYKLRAPDLVQDVIKKPWYIKVIPVVLVLLIVAIFAVMMAMGIRRMNPMFMMMPAFLLMGAMGMFMNNSGGGGSVQEMNLARTAWFIEARETRKLVQAQGSAIHALAVSLFPNPRTLLSATAYKRMWGVRKAKAYEELLANSRLTDHPFMGARVGVGMARLVPNIDHDPPQVIENLEPVTAGAFGRFLRMQRVIPNTPVYARFDQERAYGFRGEAPELRVEVSRAMIMSLAYNHLPTELAIGVISDDAHPAVKGKWDWLKWLPHCQNVFIPVDKRLPYPRLAWSSLDEFASQMRDDLVLRQTQGGTYKGPRLLVFVDTPEDVIQWPSTIAGGLDGVTLVAVRFSRDRINEHVPGHTNLFMLDPDGTFTISERPGTIAMDRVTLLEAENFARNMARWTPVGYGSADASAAASAAEDEKIPSWLNSIGIRDLDTYNPLDTWKANYASVSFRSPIGYRFDVSGDRKLPELMYLDMIEIAKGGTGPHGVVQGVTGAGKSFLLQGIVLTMCALYGPDKACFILADFKGGAAFDGYEELPHVIAVITNLEEEKELIDRLEAVLSGELNRRQNLLRRYKVPDAVSYRQKRMSNPDMPPLPDLFFFTDEFYEFMKANRQYTRLFASAGAVGRSLGVHMIPCSQFIDEGLLGDLFKHIMFGISLTASSPTYSRTVLRVDDAATLPKGGGRAMIRYLDPVTQTDKVDSFVGFNHKEKYVSTVSSGGSAAGGVLTTASPEEPSLGALPFGLKPTEDELRPPEVEDDTDKTVQTTVHDITEHDALLAHLVKYRDTPGAPKLWQESLTTPMTLADVRIDELTYMAEQPGLHLRLGDLDNPYEHTRPPFIVSPKSNVAIVGAPGKGKSMAMMTMVATTALAYQNKVSWYFIDYRGGSAPIENFPNVGAYATKQDTDLIQRIVGEFGNVLHFREEVFAKNRITSVEEYMDFTAKNPGQGDAYGYMMLAIDGIDTMFDEDVEWRERLITLAMNGPRFGLFIVASAPSPSALTHKLDKHFGEHVMLKVDEPASLRVPIPVKNKIKDLPDQNGRGIDMHSGLPTIIMIPRTSKVKPTEEASQGIRAQYSYNIPQRDEIVALGKTLASSLPRVPRVVEAPSVYPFADMWNTVNTHADLRDKSVPAKSRWLPLGIDVGTLQPVGLPMGGPPYRPHFLIAGDPGSGRTAVLRELITTITNQYTPAEAKFVIFDQGFQLVNEMMTLVQDGYMKESNYVGQRGDDVTRVVSEVLHPQIESRLPDPSKGRLDPEVIMDRAWFDKPEIFVLVNDYNTMIADPSGGANTAFDPLVPLLKESPIPNIGVHFFVTLNANGISGRYGNPPRDKFLAKTMSMDMSPMLMLSGPKTEMKITAAQLKFEERRPGRGMLLLPPSSTRIIQVAWTEKWSKPERG